MFSHLSVTALTFPLTLAGVCALPPKQLMVPPPQSGFEQDLILDQMVRTAFDHLCGSVEYLLYSHFLLLPPNPWILKREGRGNISLPVSAHFEMMQGIEGDRLKWDLGVVSDWKAEIRAETQ